MNEKTFELMQSRGELLARIAAQREQMTEIGTHWRTPPALAGQGVAAVHFLRCHPLLVAGVEAFFVIRRRGVAGLVRGVRRVVERIPLFHFLFGKVVVARLNSFGNL